MSTRKFITILLVSLLVFTIVVTAVSFAAAEEIRVCHICGFALEYSCFVLEDEDGYLWLFELEMDNYFLGDEYLLHLPDDDNPWCEKVGEVEEVQTWYRVF